MKHGTWTRDHRGPGLFLTIRTFNLFQKHFREIGTAWVNGTLCGWWARSASYNLIFYSPASHEFISPRALHSAPPSLLAVPLQTRWLRSCWISPCLPAWTSVDICPLPVASPLFSKWSKHQQSETCRNVTKACTTNDCNFQNHWPVFSVITLQV